MQNPFPQPQQAADFVGVRRLVAAFAAAGLLAMAYLTYIHFQPSGSGFCNFGAGFSCDLVNKSTYAELFGIPISVLGFGYFATVLVLTRRDLFAKYVGEIQAMTVASLVFGLYLSWIEVAVLDSICVFCEFSKLMMIGIAATTVIALRRSGAPAVARWSLEAVAVGLALVMLSRFLMV